MTDTFEFTLDNPLTEEQWDMITDVDFDRTDRIAFRTKHGKEVEFAKVIRCKDCKWYSANTGYHWGRCENYRPFPFDETDYCSRAERKDNETD